MLVAGEQSAALNTCRRDPNIVLGNRRAPLPQILFHERYQVSHWDGLILAAAKESKCSTLYSEDLQIGQTYETITVINPFL